MNCCTINKWKQNKGKMESQMRGKLFCQCKWEREARNPGVQAGHLGPASSLSFLLLLPFILHLIYPHLSLPSLQPAATVWDVDRKKIEEVEMGHKQQGRDTAKYSSASDPGDQKSPLCSTKTTLSEYQRVSFCVKYPNQLHVAAWIWSSDISGCVAKGVHV